MGLGEGGGVALQGIGRQLEPPFALGGTRKEGEARPGEDDEHGVDGSEPPLGAEAGRDDPPAVKGQLTRPPRLGEAEVPRLVRAGEEPDDGREAESGERSADAGHACYFVAASRAVRWQVR
jgi:hypothetical protein